MKTIYKTAFLFIMFLACINIYSQNQLWASKYMGIIIGSEDYAYAIAIDNSGNTFVTGKSENEIATVKYDPNGIQVWAIRYHLSSTGVNIGNSIAFFTD